MGLVSRPRAMRVLSDHPATHGSISTDEANGASPGAPLREVLAPRKRARTAQTQAQPDVLGALELWSQAVSASAELIDRCVLSQLNTFFAAFCLLLLSRAHGAPFCHLALGAAAQPHTKALAGICVSGS